ncbi:hypothetical protein ACQY0O_005977 [Thecaphora frezii]
MYVKNRAAQASVQKSNGSAHTTQLLGSVAKRLRLAWLHPHPALALGPAAAPRLCASAPRAHCCPSTLSSAPGSANGQPAFSAAPLSKSSVPVARQPGIYK